MRKSNYLWLLLVAVLLLPAQEMAAKKKKEKEGTDRELWAGVLYQMAAPVLSNMSEGKLQENMQVELSPTWDGRDKRVTYMECFGRLMAGLAPWLSLPDDDTAEGKQRRQLREWALKSYAQAVDPESQDYLLWRKEGQPLVDVAYVAESFLRGYDALWVPLDSLTKRRYIEEFTQLRRVDRDLPLTITTASYSIPCMWSVWKSLRTVEKIRYGMRRIAISSVPRSACSVSA